MYIKGIPGKLRIAANQNIKERDFWLKKFSGEPGKSTFSYDYPNKGLTYHHTPRTVNFPLHRKLFSQVTALSKGNDYTLHIVLIATLVVLVNKYTGQTDITIGTPIYKKEYIAEFINTVLALRNQITDHITFRELLLQVRQTVMEAIDNQDYPFEILLEQLNTDHPGADSQFSLFDIAIILENIHDKEYIQHVDKNITFSFLKTNEDIKGTVNFNSSLYREETIKQITNHFKTTLEKALLNLDTKISAVDILAEDEKRLLLYEFNDTKTDYPRHKSIPQLFAEQVEKTTDHIALLYETKQLTYRELNKRSIQLAKILSKRGVSANDIVGMLMERSLDMIVVILGILKAGSAYLPIEPGTPKNRIVTMLEDCNVPILLTNIETCRQYSYTVLQGINRHKNQCHLTAPRPQVQELDRLPFLDRSLVNYEKYHQCIGQAMVKHSITMQATRGCPYKCAYCFKIWPKKHVFRSAENILRELLIYYHMGVHRFVFIDDIFNFNKENSTRFFKLIIKNKLDVQLIFPSGFRADILTKDYIDLLVEAGTVSFALALETASPRLQKLVKKNLNLEKLREIIDYICDKYPNIILELQTMHGLPTETEEEAMMTLDFIKNTKWIDFPYINILKIFPNTDMEKLALNSGISAEAIARSVEMAYHELPDTLPFDKSFTLKYQSDFLNEYFLSKERFLKVLPHQIKVLTEDEIVQKYNSYLPVEITSLKSLLDFVGIGEAQLTSRNCLDETSVSVPDLKQKIKEHFPVIKPVNNALKVLLLDVSLFFHGMADMLYDVNEPPLGLMYLMTYLRQEFGENINGKIAKSRVDFDSYDELKELVEDFKPEVIGIRSMTFYGDFFHTTVSFLHQWCTDIPIIAGGPYATSNYATLLQDRNIDLVVLGEGEVTFAEIIKEIINNKGKLPAEDRLKEINGIAFIPGKEVLRRKSCREIIMMEGLTKDLHKESGMNLKQVNQPGDLAYTIFTSGSTGKPKGTFTTHTNVIRVVKDTNYIRITGNDRILQLSNYAFDGSVFDIYGALLNGAALVMIRNEDVLALDRLANILITEKITVFFVTTALFNILVDLNIESFKFIRKVLFGGERVSVEHTQNALQHLGKDRIIHVYGPTETTVYATYYWVNEVKNSQETIPIGCPIANTTIYILDKHFIPAPLGVPGQLYIGGDGVALGYLNNQELTAEKFPPNPFLENDRIYMTGDLGRCLAEGNIEFLGRIDQQVKIRGFRIEPGEIEKRFMQIRGINKAVVLDRENRKNETYLCAYVVSDIPINDETEVEELKRLLSIDLPDYMVPTYIVQLEKIPLTPNGKVDRKALPEPEATGGSAAVVSPRNPLEVKFAEIWSEVLGIEKKNIGIDADFFQLGGHSLKATQVISKLHKALHVKIPLTELFRTPTIKELAEYVRGLQESVFSSIKGVEDREYHELSSAQKRLYVLQEMELAGTSYNIPKNFVLEGVLDKENLQETFRKLIHRHESLRTAFRMLNENPVQIVQRQVDFKIEFYDLSGEEDVNHPLTNKNELITGFVRPFVLSQAPLMRVRLIREETNKHIMAVDMHHIITDGTSMDLLIKEFMVFYTRQQLPPLALQYKDYSKWQNSKETKEAIKQQESYWLKQFAGEIPVLKLPTDYPRPAVQSFAGNVIGFELSREQSSALNDLALSTGVTLYMILMAIFNILMAKISSQEDIIVGTPIAARRHVDLGKIIGMFVNTLAVRNCPNKHKSFIDFLREVKERTLEAFENQEYQFEDLVEKVTVNRDASRNPLFDVVLALPNMQAQTGDLPTAEITDLKIRTLPGENLTAKFDLNFTCQEGQDRLFFSIEYCIKLFKEKTIKRFFDYFRRIVTIITQDINIKLAEVEIITEEEKEQLLFDFNNTKTAYPRDKTIRQLFEEQVKKIPDQPALIEQKRNQNQKVPFGGLYITYRELNQKANQLAHLLIEKGVEPDTIIGIMVERSLEMMIGLLAILKAGGAYMPINPKYPQNRKKYLLEEGNVKILLTSEPDAGHYARHVVQLDNLNVYCSNSTENSINQSGDARLAYVIYTSGSTSAPKGVMVEQCSVVRLVKNTYYVEFKRNDRLLQTGALEFDASTFEIWGALLNGLSLCLTDNETILTPRKLKEILYGYQITTIWMTSPLFNQMLDADIDIFKNLKNLLVGGDILSPPHINQVKKRFPYINIINGYGPTENTTFSTTYLIDRKFDRSIPIGRPIANSTVYILDKDNHVVPIGIYGELVVGGDGVSRGYLNDPELTAEKFITNPFAPGDRAYKTGDLVRWLPDGHIEFLGRMDYQVKIRGFRIEPGEIETYLLHHEKIKDAVVVTLDAPGRNEPSEGEGEKYICAYIVPGEEISMEEIRTYLSGHLPDYMIPAYFVRLEKLPLTPNGKIDRKALPAPEIQTAGEHVLPRDAVEKALVRLWKETLNIKVVGIDDNFFEQGGHSLKATILAAKIHKVLNAQIPLAEIFRTPTIRELAQYVKKTTAVRYTSIEPAEKKEYYPLSPAQNRLYILHQIVSYSTAYNVPFYFPIADDIPVEKLEKTFMKLMQRHESLRTSFFIINEEPVQQIHDTVEFKIEYYDMKEVEVKVEEEEGTRELAPLSEEPATRNSQPATALISTFIRPFDLSQAPLLRVVCVEEREDVPRILFIDMHHIITDGTSQAVMKKEFMSLYHGEALTPLRLQYKDFSQWQSHEDQKELLRDQEQYWTSIFSDEIPVLNLPTDYPRPLLQSFEGNRVSFTLGTRETEILKNIAKEYDLTLYMILLAVLNVLCSKLSSQEDIVIGTPIAARRHADLQHIIGMMVNTLAMRNYPSANKPFNQFLKEVKQRTVEAYENQDYPFEELVEHIAVERDTSRNPLFDVLLNLLNQSEYPGEFPGTEAAARPPYQHTKMSSPFDLSFSTFDMGKQVDFILQYCTRLFNSNTIERFIQYFRNIILSLPRNIGQEIADVEYIPAEEKESILEFCSGIREIPADPLTLHQMFQERVVKAADSTALVFANQHLSCGELNRRSNQLARLLREKGVGTDTRVGVMVERSIEMVAALLAVLKAGGAYVPIDPEYPEQRILTMLNDSDASLLLTQPGTLVRHSITALKNMKPDDKDLVVTPNQTQIKKFDNLPIPDRTLIDYEKYHRYTGEAPVKNSITLQTTRGCPYSCLYCHKVWPKNHVTRSAGNIFKEISYAYDAGIRRFSFIDDIFNLDIKNSTLLLETIINSKMDIQLFFPNGFRADILTKEFIDLMMAAGTVNLDVALESASPRIQKLIKKNLNLETFKENVQYITEKYPQVILEMEMMHGFPTETREEAMMTMDFLKSLKWVHFPNLHILKIFPNTDICQLAIENGISREAIRRSQHLAFHELPETLPFPRSFTRHFQSKFMGEYFLLKERLISVLPYQMKVLTEDELVQKYDSYLSATINSFEDILQYISISREELGDAELTRDNYQAPDFCQKLRKYFPVKPIAENAFRILLLDLSQFFIEEHEYMLHHQIEEPLGLLYLLTYLDKKFMQRINGKVLKSKIDFDSYDELIHLVMDFQPDLIGIRTLSFYKELFHKAVLIMRQRGVDVPIIAGGPYATSDYQLILQDTNVDLVVLGEGEITLGQLVEKMMENNNKLPGENVLKNLPGIAFLKNKHKYQGTVNQRNCDILLLDKLWSHRLENYPHHDLQSVNQPGDLFYVIYTSGSTGKPKGVMLEHQNITNLIRYQFNHTNIDFDRVLQFTTISFDVSAQEIFSTLVAGGGLVLIGKELLTDIPGLFRVVENECLKTLFVPASFLKFLMNEEEYASLLPGSLNHIVTAGEQVIVNERFRNYLRQNNVYLHNHYGPSETHVATMLTLDPEGDIPILPSIGRPIANTTIYILDKGLHLVPLGVAGELVIGGMQVGRGYYGREELTTEKFLSSPFSEDERLYRTGDLARWLPDRNLEFLGRMDHQVKIRGFRVELREIEIQLANHDQIDECVVLAREDEKGGRYLCAYIVSREEPEISKLRESLAENLPDYMIPSFFVFLHKMPLTPNRKIDRRALPPPRLQAVRESALPRDEAEKKMVELWSEVLGVNKDIIGTQQNFFEIGGQSLKATILISRIHRAFDVKVPLVEAFKNPTVRGLVSFIKAASKEKYASVPPVEKKEYHPLSSAQGRLYILQQLDLENTVYNMPHSIALSGEPNVEKLEETFKKLIKRHESLRTSFPLVDNQPVQRVHDKVEFAIECYLNHQGGTTGLAPLTDEPAAASSQWAAITTKNFIRPFDLSQAPLLRIGLLKLEESGYRLLVDMHHIISDDISIRLLREDFAAFQAGKELAPLKIQYKDYAQWQQNSEEIKKQLKAQEQYWLKEFSGEISLLNLPTDYPRTDEMHFKGEVISFTIHHELTAKLRKLAKQSNVTLTMLLMSVFKLLLAKYSGQKEIIVGTVIAGRRHTDLENIIGFFVNMLAIKTTPGGNQRFSTFLLQLKEKTVNAYENQDYQFEELVSKLPIPRQPGRHPLVDTVFVFHEAGERVPITGTGKKTGENRSENQNIKPYSVSHFDLMLHVTDNVDSLLASLEFSTDLFKKSTLTELSNFYTDILKQVVENPGIKLEEIRMDLNLLAANSRIIHDEKEDWGL